MIIETRTKKFGFYSLGDPLWTDDDGLEEDGIGKPNGLNRCGWNDWFTIPGEWNGGNGIPKRDYGVKIQFEIDLWKARKYVVVQKSYFNRTSSHSKTEL